jgi:hypothetical protein
MEERINTKKGITKKHVKLQHWKDQMLIEIKGYAKPIKHQFKAHMGYDGKEKKHGKPKWKPSMMSMDAIHVHAEKEGKHGKVKGNTPLKTNNYF